STPSFSRGPKRKRPRCASRSPTDRPDRRSVGCLTSEETNSALCSSLTVRLLHNSAENESVSYARDGDDGMSRFGLIACARSARRNDQALVGDDDPAAVLAPD